MYMYTYGYFINFYIPVVLYKFECSPTNRGLSKGFSFFSKLGIPRHWDSVHPVGLGEVEGLPQKRSPQCFFSQKLKSGSQISLKRINSHFAPFFHEK